jgi:iron complex transport system substrate-binding protein
VDGYQTYSLETAGVFKDAAVIFVLGLEDPVTRSPIWQRLPAVAAGHVVPLELANSWGFALTATDTVADILAGVRLLEDKP